MIKRREFIAGLGSAAAWPVVGRAQHHPKDYAPAGSFPAAQAEKNWAQGTSRKPAFKSKL
jgi:hypothetical protein